MGYMNGATVAQGKPSHKGGWASGSKKEPLADDQGILAAALYELRDFSPTFLPAGKDSPAHVMGTCPICAGEVGSLGSLKVEVVDSPPRLDWFCSLHRGGFSGISYALGKHQASKPMYDLVHTESPVCTKSDTAPEVDPAADHQKEHRCSSPGLLLSHLTKPDHLEAVPIRCRRCPSCRSWLKARRISRLRLATSWWASVFMIQTVGSLEFATLTAKLRRHNRERRTNDCHNPVQYVAIPVDGGRVVLTNDSTAGGLYRPIHDVTAAVESLVNRMSPGGRISVSSNKTKKEKELEKEKEESRVRIGAIKLSATELSVVCVRHGVPRVVADSEEVVKRGRPSPIICADNGTTRSPGSGLMAARSVRRARATPSFTNRTSFTWPS